MTSIAALTRQRREKMLKMRRGTIGFAEDRLPLKRQIIHKICSGIYRECVCETTPGKPPCERLEGIAQHIIDTVRRYDLGDK